ncbi:hypothetical protein L1887_62949 [Cichorium endivia]|nr:hypothetical protein L1887_62949 [Cichorium endivia]
MTSSKKVKVQSSPPKRRQQQSVLLLSVNNILLVRDRSKESNQCSFRAQPKDPILAAAGALDGTGKTVHE